MFNFETLALNSKNYLDRLVDAGGLPYFNVFWTEPAQAAHDWPDFGDVMSRQLQAAVFLRRMTGVTAATEQIWLEKCLALINPADGLLYRPATSFSRFEADPGDAALTLYALVTAAAASGADVAAAALRMVEGIQQRLRQPETQAAWHNPFLIKPLVAAYRWLDSPAALEAAGQIVDRAIRRGRLFTPDNTFGPSGHMHGNLRAMLGAADYALVTGDAELFSRINALYQYVKTTGTRFGWIPEAIGRHSRIMLCETCALMDLAGVGVTLANHGHPEYWGDMERLARNHLAESQVRDVSFLQVDDSLPDTHQFTWQALGERLLGGWAGWSSPNHLLAARETLNHHWGGPELRDKTRLLQNCCGGSGVHALFTLWKNCAHFEDGLLSVDMHLDKLLPQAEIRCQQPYRGRTTITLRQPCAVRVRIPEFTEPHELYACHYRLSDYPLMPVKRQPGRRRAQAASASASGVILRPTRFGCYLELGNWPAGEVLEVNYFLPVETEAIAIHNPGYQPWKYTVTWKGDTVVAVNPLEDNEVATAYSDFDEAQVAVFYGSQGPAPLYQRQAMLEDAPPPPAALYEDDGSLNFWK